MKDNSWKTGTWWDYYKRGDLGFIFYRFRIYWIYYDNRIVEDKEGWSTLEYGYTIPGLKCYGNWTARSREKHMPRVIRNIKSDLDQYFS